MKKITSIIGAILICMPIYAQLCEEPLDCSYPRTIFVPRQLSYNPLLENGLTLSHLKQLDDWCYALSVKPIYTQSVGCKFKRYFNINHQPTMSVREDGTGDIDSLWFQVISSDSTFYSSELSLCPVRRTYGALFFFELKLPCNFLLSINTALATAKNSMRIREKNIQNLGTAQYKTVTQSFASNDRLYGRICGSPSKTGLDDIQIKLIKNICDNDTSSFDLYALLGIPTGSGTKATYLFEPLIGSKHAQVGLGAYYTRSLREYACGSISLLGELKWRYGFAGTERRIFDLTNNGQWSRYMLFVNEADKSATFFASNDLALQARVTPRNSLDFYLALHANRNNWQFELGYDFWFRNAEKITFNDCDKQCGTSLAAHVGIADLVGIAAMTPQSASTANISQSVVGANAMVSDPAFVAVTLDDLNINSAAQAQSISNSFYGSIAYRCQFSCHLTQLGLNVAYERGHDIEVPDNVFVWANADFTF